MKMYLKILFKFLKNRKGTFSIDLNKKYYATISRQENGEYLCHKWMYGECHINPLSCYVWGSQHANNLIGIFKVLWDWRRL